MKTESNLKTLDGTHFAWEDWFNPIHAAASVVAGLTGYALAGARIESFEIRPRKAAWELTGAWTVSATISTPAKGLKPVEAVVRSAAEFAPRVLLREPMGGAGFLPTATGDFHALGDYPSHAEGFAAELQLRSRGLAVALMSAPVLAALLPLVSEEIDFTERRVYAQKDGESGWAFDLFQRLNAITDAADPNRTPMKNLIAASDRFDWGSTRMVPPRMEIPADGEDAGKIETAKAILRSVSLMGALLPSGLNPKTLSFHPSLAELQRRRERARERYDEILAGPGLTDADRDFLLMSPPGEDAWWDVLLGTTSGTGQEGMRVLYAGLLAFWEAVFITRAMEWAGDPMRQSDDAPLPITECYAAWTGFRSGRFVPCLSNS